MSAPDFWSRRRAGVLAEERVEHAERALEAAALREAELAGRPDKEILEELGLPDPDSLKLGDDVRGFLADAVPARIRRRALRRLWRTNPVLANLDGLVDYGDDYTVAATGVEGLKTAYEVGRGFASRAAEALDSVSGEPPSIGGKPSGIDAEKSGTGAEDTHETQPVAAESEPVVELSPETEILIGRARRMSYRFES